MGGVKEKVIAAKKAGIKEIIIPEANKKDLEDIPGYITKGLKFHPVDKYVKVVEIAFGDKIHQD